jgi:hypothetical protein
MTTSAVAVLGQTTRRGFEIVFGVPSSAKVTSLTVALPYSPALGFVSSHEARMTFISHKPMSRGEGGEGLGVTEPRMSDCRSFMTFPVGTPYSSTL